MTQSTPAITRTTHSERETEQLAAMLAQSLRPGDCIALHGDLGAGKTRFVRGLAEGLRINPALVSSPTYVLMQEYTGENATLIHIDAYRLPEDDDLSSLGIDDATLHDAILVVEWAARITDALPRQRFEINIAHKTENQRTIMIQPPDDRPIQLATPDTQHCRVCNHPIEPDRNGAKHFPFCSDRCRMADLNKWFSGDYKISREIKDADLDALD